MLFWYIRSLLLISFATLCGCCSFDPRLIGNGDNYLGLDHDIAHQPRKDISERESYWDGDGVEGAPLIVIDLSDQRLYYYKGEDLVGISAVSTGKEGKETRTGHFHITQKDKDHSSSQYGTIVDSNGTVIVQDASWKTPKPAGTHFEGSPMPYFMRIYGGVGMHEGFLPGTAASHGCIRLPERMAKIFFMNTPKGTKVTIKK